MLKKDEEDKKVSADYKRPNHRLARASAKKGGAAMLRTTGGLIEAVVFVQVKQAASKRSRPTPDAEAERAERKARCERGKRKRDRDDLACLSQEQIRVQRQAERAEQKARRARGKRKRDRDDLACLSQEHIRVQRQVAFLRARKAKAEAMAASRMLEDFSSVLGEERCQILLGWLRKTSFAALLSPQEVADEGEFSVTDADSSTDGEPGEEGEGMSDEGAAHEAAECLSLLKSLGRPIGLEEAEEAGGGLGGGLGHGLGHGLGGGLGGGLDDGGLGGGPFGHNKQPTHKQRFVWTSELHRRFEAAVNTLGVDQAKPQVKLMACSFLSLSLSLSLSQMASAPALFPTSPSPSAPLLFRRCALTWRVRSTRVLAVVHRRSLS
jgi:SHAQKYF class myb-like DNA-binding protein